MATNESTLRLHVSKAAQFLGWAPKHWQDARPIFCKKCGHKNLITPNVSGRADLKLEHYGLSIPDAWIEMKDCKKPSFEFSEISPDQREFLSDHEHSYIGIGAIIPKGTQQSQVHSIYVIPWKEWIAAEMDIEMLLGDKSMPYDYTLYTNNVQHRTTDLVSRFKDYRLIYRDKYFHFPYNHPLAIQEEILVPHFLREKEIKAHETSQPS